LPGGAGEERSGALGRHLEAPWRLLHRLGGHEAAVSTQPGEIFPKDVNVVPRVVGVAAGEAV